MKTHFKLGPSFKAESGGMPDFAWCETAGDLSGHITTDASKVTCKHCLRLMAIDIERQAQVDEARKVRKAVWAGSRHQGQPIKSEGIRKSITFEFEPGAYDSGQEIMRCTATVRGMGGETRTRHVGSVPTEGTKEERHKVARLRLIEQFASLVRSGDITI